MKKILNIAPPTMPNFFHYEVPAGQKQDGFNFNNAIPISELSAVEALEFGEMMKQEFLKHWKQKKGYTKE